MDKELETVVRILAIIIGTSTVIGLGAKWVLLPWLKTNLVEPVKEVNTQVTLNGNVSDPATMLDTVHIIEEKVDSLEDSVHKMAIDAATVGAATGVIRGMWDHHLEWSEHEVDRIWKAISRLENKGANNEREDR